METLLLFAFMALVALAERSRLRWAPLRFARRFMGTDLVCFVTGGLALGLLARVAAARLVGDAAPAAAALAALPWLAAYLLGLVLYDLSAYLTHAVLLHRVPFLWKVHSVHHSSRTLDWLATYRAHIVEHALRHLLSAFALVALGFPVAVVGAVAATYAAWATLGHSNLKLPLRALEGVLITPRLHRLHHVPQTTDANFGTILSVWDRVFGTLVTDPDSPTEPLGVPDAVETYPQSWLPQLVEPFRRRARRPVVVARS